METETLEFSQEELRILSVVLLQVALKYPDSKIVNPIIDKIKDRVKEEPPVEPEKPVEGVVV